MAQTPCDLSTAASFHSLDTRESPARGFFYGRVGVLLGLFTGQPLNLGVSRWIDTVCVSVTALRVVPSRC